MEAWFVKFFWDGGIQSAAQANATEEFAQPAVKGVIPLQGSDDGRAAQSQPADFNDNTVVTAAFKPLTEGIDSARFVAAQQQDSAQDKVVRRIVRIPLNRLTADFGGGIHPALPLGLAVSQIAQQFRGVSLFGNLAKKNLGRMDIAFFRGVNTFFE